MEDNFLTKCLPSERPFCILFTEIFCHFGGDKLRDKLDIVRSSNGIADLAGAAKEFHFLLLLLLVQQEPPYDPYHLK